MRTSKMPLERIQKLIELAVGSANEHEARNAAVLACKKLREYGVVLTLPGTEKPKINPSKPRVGARAAQPELRTVKRKTKCFWCDRTIYVSQQIYVASRKSYHVKCFADHAAFFNSL